MELDIDRLKSIELNLMREAFDLAFRTLNLSQPNLCQDHAACLEGMAAVIQTYVERGHTDVAEIAHAAVCETMKTTAMQREKPLR